MSEDDRADSVVNSETGHSALIDDVGRPEYG